MYIHLEEYYPAGKIIKIAFCVLRWSFSKYKQEAKSQCSIHGIIHLLKNKEKWTYIFLKKKTVDKSDFPQER